ncbi:hypothetical protein GCM10008090_18240 [Arenicella chitinivorans]|uniref:Uncharacterized protein n=1 Tax=Arenicella chitinivorans TaxID=1329800 RepID=A0A918VKG6_9GAMM|nr:DUF3379 family protein [Arenicella chitinivorans]GHA08723.1 hypothetical protein GCM10008090_18240 [Arenicella chitinivorans]
MNCLEFKRVALAEPQSEQQEFVAHARNCPECQKYLSGIKQMDTRLAASLEVSMPTDLVARLKLHQGMEARNDLDRAAIWRQPRYAIAASFVVVFLVAGILSTSWFGFQQQVSDDYEAMLAGVIEHMEAVPMTPVWEVGRANAAANTLLASYQPNMKLKYLDNLQFSKICPMGRYRGIHASLETPEGTVTFAYIKGEPVGEIVDTAYQGMVTRVKPVRGGNLVIVSHSSRGLHSADRQLEQAIYWDI